jgi:hypothetical protein
MLHRSIAVTAALVLGSGALAAADAPKPLRTLVYSVQYSSQSRNTEQTSGFSGSDSGPSGTSMGHGAVERNSNVSDDGTLTIDVVGASADAGLVVDAAYAGKTTAQPAIRVAIFPDGRLSIDPRHQLSPEAARVLPLLARGLVAGRDVSPGSAWKTDVAPPAKGSIAYRVSALEGQQATLVIDSDIKVPGPQGYDEQGHGTAKYATDLLCPLTYDLEAHSRHQPSADQYVTSNSHLTATLVSDSFAKK